MNILSRSAISLYWGMLTPEARILTVVQILLLIGRLLLPVLAADGWGWFTATHSNDLRISALGVEAILLIVYLIQWCAWSELIYSMRLSFRPSQTSKSSTKRRFALHLYSGFIFLIVLSGLVTVQPLLGIGAMFLLFMSAEAQASSLAQRPLPVALLWGMRRSYKLISREPWQFLGLLVLPGVVLYGYGALLVSVGISGGWGLAATLLMLIPWCACFLLAQLRVALRGVPRDQASSSFHQRLGTFNQQCDRLGWLVILGMGLWLLFRLSDAGLLSVYALALAFGQVVTLLSSTVTAFLSLLVKAGFIAIVLGIVSAVLMLIIDLGQGAPLKQLQSVVVYLQRCLRALSEKLGPLVQEKLFKGASLGLGTLLTALGTVAVQTYERVQKDQERQIIAREEWQRLQTKQEEEVKARTTQNDEMVARVIKRIEELRKETVEAKKLPLQNQLLTELRDVLPELKLANGEIDGDRKGRLLRYLYESDLLEAKGICGNAITPELRGKPAKEVQESLKKAECTPSLYLHEMDFSGSTLKNAYLNNAFLPLLDLKNSDLRNARLKGAKLNLANLENADLEGADLTETNLSGSILVGANLTDTINEKDKSPTIDGAIAFYAVHTRTIDDKIANKVVSWDLTKSSFPGEAISSPWTFCPLDPQSNLLPLKRRGKYFSQAGSKCRNRRFDPHDEVSPLKSDNMASSEFHYRDWSGSSFKKSSLKGMVFDHIKLDGADLSGAILEDMNLKNVSFAGANLQDTVFRESALENVNFTGANLKGFRLERMRKLTNLNYLGSVIDLDKNPTFTTYAKNRLDHLVYDQKSFGNQTPNELATFRQRVFAPFVMTALTFRPQQLLYWMVSYPQPGAYLPKNGQR